MQVAYKHATAVAFHSIDIKNKYFVNTVRDFSLYVISCIRQPVVQELQEIHDVYPRKFCRSTSAVGFSNVRPAKPFHP